MRQKKWEHCPACGAKQSMVLKKTLIQRLRLKSYPVLVVKNLKGYQCQSCREAILTIGECRRIDRLVGEHKARVDSKRVVAADLMEVSQVKNILGISRQRVHQMMVSGKIPYVYVDQTRIPIKFSHAA